MSRKGKAIDLNRHGGSVNPLFEALLLRELFRCREDVPISMARLPAAHVKFLHRRRQ